jgi:uncharacterized phiE125 gp8 family phage protein
MRVTETAPAATAVALGEIKAYLRIEGAHEDALLAGLARTATALCEAFTGLALVERPVRERMPADGRWRRLARAPVAGVDGVDLLAADGAPTPLVGEAWAVEQADVGEARVRVVGGPADQLAQVRYRAGVGADWNAVPEPLRQGIVRLVAHLYAHRDAAAGGAPPSAAVAALWRPWRRMRLA